MAKQPLLPLEHDVDVVVAELKAVSSPEAKAGMARYAIPDTHALGIMMNDIKAIAKRLGKDHDLAQDLWKTGIYDARQLCAFVDDPKQVTPAQMDRWCNDFDNWAICDGICFHLFDKTPHAFTKIKAWAPKKPEYVRRAAFALMASVALHNKKLDDDVFLECLPLCEKWAIDDRNFVKKAVSWALRGIAKRSKTLKTAVKELSTKLAESEDRGPRWIGKDVLRQLK